MRELLAAVRSALLQAHSAADRSIELAVDPTVPLELIGSPPRIRQILLSYLGNALIHGGSGRVTLSAFAAPCGNGRSDLTVLVGDEGPGIASGRQERLFDQGTLGACRAWADEMGGHVRLRSEPGHGAVFYLRLPLPVPAEPGEALPVDLAFAGPLFALVVEAEEFRSAGLVALLRQLRIEVELAPNVTAALDRCQAQAFALVFVDEALPDRSGLQLARELRRREAGERRAVVIATPKVPALDTIDDWLDAGLDGFIALPTTLPQLRSALGEWFGPRGGELPLRLPLGRGRLREPWRLDTLRYIANGDAAELARMTRRYVRDLEACLLEMQSALDRSDFGSLQQSAHRLVAHFQIIEHEPLIAAAQEIEESAVNRNRAAASAKWADVLFGTRPIRVRLVADSEGTPSE